MFLEVSEKLKLISTAGGNQSVSFCVKQTSKQSFEEFDFSFVEKQRKKKLCVLPVATPSQNAISYLLDKHTSRQIFFFLSFFSLLS